MFRIIAGILGVVFAWTWAVGLFRAGKAEDEARTRAMRQKRGGWYQ